MKYKAEPGERGSHTDQGISEQEMSFMSWQMDYCLEKKSVISERHSYEIYRLTWLIYVLLVWASWTATFLNVIWTPEIWLHTHNDNHFLKLWNMQPITKLFLTVMRTAHIIILKWAFNSSTVIISPLKNLYFETTDYISLSPPLNSSLAIFLLLTKPKIWGNI